MTEEHQIGTVIQDDKETDYGKIPRHGNIYRLEGIDGYYYYGSTQQRLDLRMTNHIVAQRLPIEQRQKVTQHFSEIGWHNVRIVSVKKMLCTRKELRIGEGEFIKEHLGQPFCLNEMQAGRYETEAEKSKRYYEEKLSAPIQCGCGDTVTTASMTGHLLSKRHAHNIAIKTLPESEAQLAADLFETCPCGDKVKRRNLPQHRTTERHLWNLRIKYAGPVDLSIPLPPPLPASEGQEKYTVQCQCRCGTIISRQNYTTHLKSSKHIRRMMESGLMPIPDIKIVLDPEVPEGKQRCICGAIIARSCRIQHYETVIHKATVRELGLVDEPPIEEIQEEDEQLVPRKNIPKEHKSSKVQCECGTMICTSMYERHKMTEKHLLAMEQKEKGLPSPSKIPKEKDQKVSCECGTLISKSMLTRHKETDKHRLAMERKEKDLPTPAKGLARMKEKMTCECGSKMTRGNIDQHRATAKHREYEAKKLAEAGAAGTEA